MLVVHLSRLADAADPPPEEYRLDAYAMSWSWNGGLHYGIDVPALHEGWQGGDLQWLPLLRGDVGIRLAIDAVGVRRGGDFLALGDDVGARRAYFYADGNLALWKQLTYKLEVGAVDDRFSLRNASLAVHGIPYAGTFTLGTFDAPMSLSYLTSSRATPLMERGLPVDAFAPGTKTGFQLANWLPARRLTWAFGLFTPGRDADIGDSSEVPVRFVGRVTWLPWRSDERRLLHVGLGVSGALSTGDNIRFRSRPESFFAPYVVDTGELEGRQATVGGLEAAWMRDRLSVQGEYMQSEVFRDGLSDPLFGGLYLMGSYFLTPDARSYDEASAAFAPLRPSRPLSWKLRQLGALEVALRWSFIDLTADDVRGGQAHEIMSGLNWYWNRYVRMQFNVGWAGVSGGPRPGDYVILQGRLDLTL